MLVYAYTIIFLFPFCNVATRPSHIIHMETLEEDIFCFLKGDIGKKANDLHGRRRKKEEEKVKVVKRSSLHISMTK